MESGNKLTNINARDFSDEEISEINRYITTNIPYSVLQTIFPITENTNKKIQVFTIVYRFINSAKNYVKSSDTKDKLDALLIECKDVYAELYKNMLTISNSNINWGLHRIKQRNEDILINVENNMKINKLIDCFLIFSEKQTFFDTDKVAGLEINEKEGEELMNKLLEDN